MSRETTSPDPVRPEMTTARWLFNPFIRVDGARALLIGLSVIAASGPAAALGGVHFDGLPDFTPTYGAPAWVPVGEGFVTWFVLSVFIGLVARVLAPRSVRFVDIAGPQALARFPLLVAALLCVLPAMRRANVEMLSTVADGGSIVPPPAWAFFVAAFVGFSCGVWTLWLMWKGFSVACGLRGGWAWRSSRQCSSRHRLHRPSWWSACSFRSRHFRLRAARQGTRLPTVQRGMLRTEG